MTSPEEKQTFVVRGGTELVATGVPTWLTAGRYTYVSTLGSGGMGTVYLVQDQHVLRQVALKVMRPELASNADDAARFIEEARAVGQLEHSHIVPLYDMGRGPTDELFYTMQYIKGQPLRVTLDALKDEQAEAHGRWPFQKRAQALLDLSDALAFAHERGVLHRDVKPANILVTQKDELVLTDWGISVRTDPDGPVAGPQPLEGTPGYIAPEGHQSERSEVFSLGVVMYQFLCLETPSQVDAVPPDTHLLPLQGRVPRELALICMRCLEKDPQRRYASMTELSEALVAYLHGVAPVVCVQTGLKRAVFRLVRLADDHGSAIIVGLCVAVVLPLASLVAWWFAVHR